MTMTKYICLVHLLLAAGCLPALAKRVMLVPIPNVSHTRYMTNVAQALVDRGHQAWVCMPFSVAVQPVFNLTGVHVLRYSNENVDVVDDYMKYVRDAYWADREVDVTRMMDILFRHVVTMLEDQQLDAGIQEIQPDLIIIDNIPPMQMISVLAYKFAVPFAFVGSLYYPIPHRVPFTPATLPQQLYTDTQYMTFSQRSRSFAIYSLMLLFEMFSYTDAVARFAPNRPYLPVRELTAQAEIVLVETDTVLDYPKVSLPNLRLIGGTAVSHAGPLKEPFKSFVETAENGVVIVSFGSYIVDFPEPIAKKLSSAFQRLPFKVIWRVNMSSPHSKHILTSTWIPQNDLLAHPYIKVLVSHCGQSSQYEALFHGVPTLCMPLFLDQPYNAERTRSKGHSLTLDIKTSTEEEIASCIQQLYHSSLYKTNVQKASRLFRTLHGLPKETAAYWIDHIMEHGGAHLRNTGQGMHGYEFYCVDVLSAYVIILVIACIAAIFVVRKCVRVTLLAINVLQFGQIRIKAKVL